jgi:hypothetical protein
MLAGQMLAETLEGAGDSSETNKFFQQTAHEIVSVVLYGAASAGKDMDFVLDAMYGMRGALYELEQIIFNSDSQNAKRFFTSLTLADDRTKRNIETTAKLCFKAYTTNRALASSLHPNFNPAKFARSSDTIYITAPPNQQELVGPLIVTYWPTSETPATNWNSPKLGNTRRCIGRWMNCPRWHASNVFRSWCPKAAARDYSSQHVYKTSAKQNASGVQKEKTFPAL